MKSVKNMFQAQTSTAVDFFENSGVAIWHEDASSLYVALCDIAREHGSIAIYLQQNPHELPRLIDLIQIIDVNDAAVSLFHAANKKELLTGIRDFFMKESYFDFFKMIVHLFAGNTSYTYSSSKLTKNGHKCITQITVTIPESSISTWDHMIVSEVDITHFIKREVRLKRSLEKVDAALDSKEKLLSIIAHDLKNPFNNILGFSELILKKYDSLQSDTIYEYLQYIHESACQSYHLLTNLLQWGTCNNLSATATIESCSIIAIVQEVVELVKTSCISKEIEVKTDILEEHIAYADYYMTSFVVRNVVTNAIKFSHARSYIFIRSYVQDNFLHIEVRDTGIGMDTHVQGSLFSTEVTKSRPGTHNELGTGIGLILCKEFIEKQAGKLLVETIEGHGTTVTIVLPMKKYQF